jgi:hypothetical protein
MVKGYQRKKMPNRIIKEREVSLPIQPLSKQKLVKPKVIIKEVQVIKFKDKIVEKRIPFKEIKEVEVIKKVYIPRPKLTPEESRKNWEEKTQSWNLKQKIKGVEKRIEKLQTYLKILKGGQTQNESLSVVG